MFKLINTAPASASTPSAGKTTLFIDNTGVIATKDSSGVSVTYLTTAGAGAAYQPLDADLTAIAGLTYTADKSIYFNGTDWATYDLTSVGRTLLAAATQAAQRTAIQAVGLVGDESVAGEKRFSSRPVFNAGARTSTNQQLRWGDGVSADVGAFTCDGSGTVLMAGNSGAGTGGVRLRPVGIASSTGQVTVNADGSVTFSSGQAATRASLGAVGLTGDESIAGVKTFTGTQVRIQSTAPGFWLDESDNSFGLYFGLDGNILQFQVRPSGFTPSIVDIPMRMDFTNKWIGLVYNLRPMVDNSIDVGTASLRIRTYYGVNSAINTSDARDKTAPRDLTESEFKAASAIARLPAVWRWLHRVNGDENNEPEGMEARKHFGPTVQAAIATMEANGLDPFAYSFICYDKWEAEEATFDEEGNELTPSREAGDRYSFRKEELLCFIVAALAAENDKLQSKLNSLDARLSALEAK